MMQMKRILNISLLIFLTFVEAIAQISTTNSISINVSATVMSNSPVELTTLNNMIIEGDITSNKEIYISPLTNRNAGLMLAKGRPNSRARMTYLINETLTNKKGTGKISLVYEMSGYPERIQKASNLISTGDFILNFGNDGAYYLWLGVRANLEYTLPGSYVGKFTVEIEYI